jgi:hypothetical protein
MTAAIAPLAPRLGVVQAARGNTESVALRTATDTINRVTPLMIMLTPASVPIAQAELDGHCI